MSITPSQPAAHHSHRSVSLGEERLATQAVKKPTRGPGGFPSARVLAHAGLTDLSRTVPLTTAIVKSTGPIGRRLRNVSDLILGSRWQPAPVAGAGRAARDSASTHGHV